MALENMNSDKTKKTFGNVFLIHYIQQQTYMLDGQLEPLSMNHCISKYRFMNRPNLGLKRRKTLLERTKETVEGSKHLKRETSSVAAWLWPI